MAKRIKGKIIVIVYRTKTIAFGQIGKLGEPHSPIGHPSCTACLLSKVLPELVVRVLLIDIKRLNNRSGTRPLTWESIQMVRWYGPWWWAAYYAAPVSYDRMHDESSCFAIDHRIDRFSNFGLHSQQGNCIYFKWTKWMVCGFLPQDTGLDIDQPWSWMTTGP